MQMPLNRIARLGSRPITRGNTKVAPNIATTCWAPRPAVLPQPSRWSGATASPGAGSTTSHLNIDTSTTSPVPGTAPARPSRLVLTRVGDEPHDRSILRPERQR